MSFDPRWMTKEAAGDHDSQGKTTAQPRGTATRKELPNGGAKRRLTSRRGIKLCKGEGPSAIGPFFGGGE
jgi:hypothetical protein